MFGIQPQVVSSQITFDNFKFSNTQCFMLCNFFGVFMQVSLHIILHYRFPFYVLSLNSFLFAYESYFGFGEDLLLK